MPNDMNRNDSTAAPEEPEAATAADAEDDTAAETDADTSDPAVTDPDSTEATVAAGIVKVLADCLENGYSIADKELRNTESWQ